MYLDESYLELFKGTGKANANNESLKEFLEKYDPNKYQNPSNTVDTLVFTYIEKNGHKEISKLLLIKRGNHPCIGCWALPGGFVDYREDIEKAALRELKEETGIDDIEAEQLKTYGAFDRDPRTRVITTAFVALVPEGSVSAEAADDASDSGWFDIKETLLESVIDKDNIIYDTYELTLTKEASKDDDSFLEPTVDAVNRKIKIKALVEVTKKDGAILKNKTYKIKKTNGISADHGAIILEGYQYLTNKLKDVK